MRHLRRTFAIACTAGILASCASAGGGGGGTATNGVPGTPGQNNGAPNVIWPVKTREHVDLWLHGFALLQEDTTFVPFFKRGYSTNMIVLKNRANAGRRGLQERTEALEFSEKEVKGSKPGDLRCSGESQKCLSPDRALRC